MKILEISNIGIGDEGISFLSAYLSNITKIETLSICDNQITDKGMNELIDKLKCCKCLKKILIFGIYYFLLLKYIGNKLSNYEDIKKKIDLAFPDLITKTEIVKEENNADDCVIM